MFTQAMSGTTKIRQNFSISPKIMKELRARSDRSEEGESMSAMVERGLKSIFDPKPPQALTDDAALHQLRLKYLSRLPCGPLREATAEASDFVVSGDIADTLEIRHTDFVVMAEGESMMGPAMEKGDILDGDYLILRPQDERRNPPTGEVVLAQIVTEDGVAEATIKFWNNGSPPFLTDGHGERVALPEGELRAVGVLRGLLRKY